MNCPHMAAVPEKIMVITVTDDRDCPKHFWKQPLEDSCQTLIWVDLGSVYFNNGRRKTHKILLNIFNKEKPDYLFMFDSLYYDLDLPLLLTNFKELSPKTKLVIFSGDDDSKFDSIRYLALFFDYVFIAQ